MLKRLKLFWKIIRAKRPSDAGRLCCELLMEVAPPGPGGGKWIWQSKGAGTIEWTVFLYNGRVEIDLADTWGETLQ